MAHIELVQKRTDQLEPGDVVAVDRQFSAWTEDAKGPLPFTPHQIGSRGDLAGLSWGVVHEVFNVADEPEPPNARAFASGNVLQSDLYYLWKHPEMRLVLMSWPAQDTNDYLAGRCVVVSVFDPWTVQQVKEN